MRDGNQKATDQAREQAEVHRWERNDADIESEEMWRRVARNAYRRWQCFGFVGWEKTEVEEGRTEEVRRREATTWVGPSFRAFQFIHKSGASGT
jgi:hypothetical protein